jgi:hypothetical protein
MVETTPPKPATPAKPTPGQQLLKEVIQLGVLMLIVAVLFNVAFRFLSELYYADRVRRFGPTELLAMPGARRGFLWLTIAVGVVTTLVPLSPRIVGYTIAGLASIASLVAAYGSWTNDLPGVLAVSLVLLALVFPLLIWRSFVGARAAWAFMISLMGVYALMLFFGAPKVGRLLDISMWYAMIAPAVLAIGLIALISLRGEYANERIAAVPVTPSPAVPEKPPLEPAELARRRKAALW